MSTLSTIAAPIEPRGFFAKAGVFTAGTALAGAALFGGAAVAPTITSGFSASVQHDYVLTADAFPTFTESLQTLLNTLGYGDMGQVLGLLGDNPDGTPIGTGSELSALLAALNPDGATLNDITGDLFSTDISGLLGSIGTTSIDSLIGGFIGGAGADTAIGTLLGYFGLGDYAGLLNLPFAGLSPNDTVAELLNSMLGITDTTTLNDLVIGNGETLGEATLGGLLGIDGDTSWSAFLDGITLGGTLADPDGTGTLGDMSLGDLLGSLAGGTVTDATTLTDFLGDLGIFQMLGLG